MTEAGFYAQRRNSPTSLALVILLHAALLAAVIMIKGPQFIRDHHHIIVDSYPIEPDPPADRPPPRARHEQPTHITQPERIIETETTTQTVAGTDDPPQLPPDTGTTITPPADPPLPPPVRRAAELDPRYAGELQPPYPAAEQRAQRGGRVQVRVTIAPSGRVSAVARLTATSDAFWRATEQQALNHWRFRPATVDGRPVESSKVMTLVFRIEDAV
jgi:periplasmic protein TonB